MASQMGVFPPSHVITTAPGYGGGSNVPRGLEYLNSINELRIKQKIDYLEICCCCEIANTYAINNSVGEQIFSATEGSNVCLRHCLRKFRPFEMTITDNTGADIIHLSRPCRCQSCWYPCFLQEITVMSPASGNLVLGHVKQDWSIFKSRYTIENANHEPILKIIGPCCPISCFFCDVHFQIFSLNEDSIVGEIRKEWSSCLKECCTFADNFTISFEQEVDVATKATVLGCALLSDYMFFER